MSELGNRFGDFTTVSLFGHGGMGRVYLARHIHTGARVALKVLAVKNAHTLRAMRVEISALQHIRHPGVVTIVDHGFRDGVPWIAMELVEGISFASQMAMKRALSGDALLDTVVDTFERLATSEGNLRDMQSNGIEGPETLLLPRTR